MRGLACLASFLLCAACAAGPDAAWDDAYPVTAQLAPPAGCREFAVQVPVAGEWRQGVEQACRQADGSWRVVESAPGAPPEIYVLPPQTVWLAPSAPPWSWAAVPPAFAGDFFFFDGFHHRHRRDERRHHRRDATGHHAFSPTHGRR